MANKEIESGIGYNLPAGWIEKYGLIDPSTLDDGEEEDVEEQPHERT